MKKNLRRPAIAIFAATAALSVATTAAWAEQKDSCKAARSRVAANAALFKEGGACDLGDDGDAVRPAPYGAALTHFRAIKQELMNTFDKDTAGTIGADLAALSSAASDYIKDHADKTETVAKLRPLVSKIASLNKAVDAMRPNSATNSGTIHAIDHALGDLQDTCNDDHDSQAFCPGAGTGALETLDTALQADTTVSTDTALAALKDKVHAITGDGSRLGDSAEILDRMRHVFNCRTGDEQAARDRACTEVAAPTPPATHGAPAPVLPKVPFILVADSTAPNDSMINFGAALLNPPGAPKPSDPNDINSILPAGWHYDPSKDSGSGSATAPGKN